VCTTCVRTHKHSWARECQKVSNLAPGLGGPGSIIDFLISKCIFLRALHIKINLSLCVYLLYTCIQLENSTTCRTATVEHRCWYQRKRIKINSLRSLPPPTWNYSPNPIVPPGVGRVYRNEILCQQSNSVTESKSCVCIYSLVADQWARLYLFAGRVPAGVPGLPGTVPSQQQQGTYRTRTYNV